jgi:hypothetical protein
MPYSQYKEEEIEEFINVANEMGIGPAMRYLKYPKSYHTAKKFYIQRKLDLPTPDSLKLLARNLGIFYTDKEKIITAQAVLDRAFEKLMEDNINSDELNKISNAIHKAIQTINLIEGKSTNISENRSKDGTDLALIDMINEAKIKNNEMKERILSKALDKENNI